MQYTKAIEYNFVQTLYRTTVKMTYIAIISLTYFMEMLISYSFFSQIGERKVTVIKCVLTGTLLFGSGALVNFLLSNIVWVNTVYFLITNILFGFICYRIKITRLIFYSALLDIFSTALEFATIFLVSVITDTDTKAYLNQINMLIVELVISKLLYFLVCNITARLIKKEKSNIRFPLVLYMYPITVIAVLLAFWNICAKSNIIHTQKISFAIISAALFFSVVLLFIMYQHNIEKENELFLLQNQLEKIETDKIYYDILEKQNQELRIYAHDAKNHLSAIRELNDNPIIEDYVNTMSDALKTYSSSCRSGNHLLDVIINKYEAECQLKNITFSFDVKLCNLDLIENYDLVAILGNLLDNAVRAAENTENAFISLYTHYANTYAVLEISNSCSTSPVFSNKDLLTTKENRILHGLGIKSVKKTLKKYSGELECKYDEKDKIFTAVLIILAVK